jgi:hypothetical protein
LAWINSLENRMKNRKKLITKTPRWNTKNNGIPRGAGERAKAPNPKDHGLLRNPRRAFSVIPAEAGIQESQGLLDPGFRRGDDLKDLLRSYKECLSKLVTDKLRTWLSSSKAAMGSNKGLIEIQISFG